MIKSDKNGVHLKTCDYSSNELSKNSRNKYIKTIVNISGKNKDDKEFETFDIIEKQTANNTYNINGIT